MFYLAIMYYTFSVTSIVVSEDLEKHSESKVYYCKNVPNIKSWCSGNESEYTS